MDWKKYEEITKYIYETLGSKSGVKIVAYGNTCKVKRKSGVYHQIDVLTSHSDGIHNYQTAIECKYWEEKISKEVVMKVAEIIEDTGINKGVIVSTKGYTKDGESFAKYKNIGLVELREIETKDQERIPSFKVMEGTINTKVEVRRPEIVSIEVDSVDPYLKFENTNPYHLILELKDGRQFPIDSYLTSFKKDLHEEQADKIVQKYYELKDANLINRTTKEVVQIKGLTFKGKLTIINKDLLQKIEIFDEVWMIMKSLFENNSFTISRMGMIKKDET